MRKEFDKKLGDDFIKSVPEEPGVYLFRNSANTVIYVGKAKNLKTRLAQYRVANRKKKHRKMRAILKNSVHVELRTCASEKEALLLENQLIQDLKPYLNLCGAYSFLYPYIGISWESQKPSWLGLCYTTVPEEFVDSSFTLFGAYRSRAIVKNAYRSLKSLLQYISHRDEKETQRYRDYPYTGISFYRQVDRDLHKGLTVFFRGESEEGLADLTKLLLEKPDARKDASEIQEHLKKLMWFYKLEAHKLRGMLEKLGMPQSYISQYDRDRLFIAAPFGPETVKRSIEIVEKS